MGMARSAIQIKPFVGRPFLRVLTRQQVGGLVVVGCHCGSEPNVVTAFGRRCRKVQRQQCEHQHDQESAHGPNFRWRVFDPHWQRDNPNTPTVGQ